MLAAGAVLAATAGRDALAVSRPSPPIQGAISRGRSGGSVDSLAALDPVDGREARVVCRRHDLRARGVHLPDNLIIVEDGLASDSSPDSGAVADDSALPRPLSPSSSGTSFFSVSERHASDDASSTLEERDSQEVCPPLDSDEQSSIPMPQRANLVVPAAEQESHRRDPGQLGIPDMLISSLDLGTSSPVSPTFSRDASFLSPSCIDGISFGSNFETERNAADIWPPPRVFETMRSTSREDSNIQLIAEGADVSTGASAADGNPQISCVELASREHHEASNFATPDSKPVAATAPAVEEFFETFPTASGLICEPSRSHTQPASVSCLNSTSPRRNDRDACLGGQKKHDLQCALEIQASQTAGFGEATETGKGDGKCLLHSCRHEVAEPLCSSEPSAEIPEAGHVPVSDTEWSTEEPMSPALPRALGDKARAWADAVCLHRDATACCKARSVAVALNNEAELRTAKGTKETPSQHLLDADVQTDSNAAPLKEFPATKTAPSDGHSSCCGLSSEKDDAFLGGGGCVVEASPFEVNIESAAHNRGEEYRFAHTKATSGEGRGANPPDLQARRPDAGGAEESCSSSSSSAGGCSAAAPKHASEEPARAPRVEDVLAEVVLDLAVLFERQSRDWQREIFEQRRILGGAGYGAPANPVLPPPAHVREPCRGSLGETAGVVPEPAAPTALVSELRARVSDLFAAQTETWHRLAGEQRAWIADSASVFPPKMCTMEESASQTDVEATVGLERTSGSFLSACGCSSLCLRKS